MTRDFHNVLASVGLWSAKEGYYHFVYHLALVIEDSTKGNGMRFSLCQGQSFGRSKDAVDVEAYNVIINDPDKKVSKENRNDLNESIEFHPIENMSEMNDSSVSEQEKLNISLMNVPDM